MTAKRFDDEKNYPHFSAAKQLEAIRGASEQVFAWRNELHGEIAEAERTAKMPDTSDHYHEVAYELYERALYRDAVAVQAWTGMVAPFLEGFLVRAFGYLGTLPAENIPVSVSRRRVKWEKQTNTNMVDRSDPRFWNPREPSIEQGTRALRDAALLHNWINDADLDQIVLLFKFRNKSLHGGCTWISDVVKENKAHSVPEKKEDHLNWATTSGVPFIAYLKDTFLSDTLALLERMLLGFEKVARDKGGFFRSGLRMPWEEPGGTPPVHRDDLA